MGTIEIPISKGYVAIVDEIDMDLAQFQWTAIEAPYTVYAARMVATIEGKRKSVGMHRFIYERVLGRELTQRDLVDHIHGNGLDNRRSELRLATKGENTRNQRLRNTNTSGFKGVSWDKKRGKWAAQIWIEGVNIRLGHFDTREEAHEEYRKAALVWHREFANFGDNALSPADVEYIKGMVS